jgi:hypothetical protein
MQPKVDIAPALCNHYCIIINDCQKARYYACIRSALCLLDHPGVRGRLPTAFATPSFKSGKRETSSRAGLLPRGSRLRFGRGGGLPVEPSPLQRAPKGGQAAGFPHHVTPCRRHRILLETRANCPKSCRLAPARRPTGALRWRGSSAG